MTISPDPSLDDILLDLLVDDAEPTHAHLVAALEAHPRHRDALIAFFAAWGVQAALEAEEPARDVEHFANRGVSSALNLQYARQTAAVRPNQAAEASVPAQRLSAMARRRGLSDAQLAERVGLDEVLIAKLDRHRIPAPRPRRMFELIGEAIEVPAAHVIASATGPPIASSRGRMMKAKGPLVMETESFEEAIRRSTLSDEAKAAWIALMADENEPKA